MTKLSTEHESEETERSKGNRAYEESYRRNLFRYRVSNMQPVRVSEKNTMQF